MIRRLIALLRRPRHPFAADSAYQLQQQRKAAERIYFAMRAKP